MKTTIFLTVLVLIMISVSCEKIYRDRPDVMPYFNAMKNDTVWISSGGSSNLFTKNMKFRVTGSKRDSTYAGEVYHLSMQFSLEEAMKLKNVTRFYSEWLWIQGGDVVRSRYVIDTLANNSITITSLDTMAKTITGTFSVQLVRPKGYTKKDTLRYTNGKFGFVYTKVPYLLTDPVIQY